jgi:hypothetical protein
MAGMQPVSSNLRFELVWSDSDMLEFQVSAASEAFSGRTNFYAGFDELPSLATTLAGFPTSSADVRTAEFGMANLPGYGRVKLRFYCQDSSGHLVAEVSIASVPVGPKDVAENAVIQVEAVPADIDSFISQLQGIGTHIGATASLKFAT